MKLAKGTQEEEEGLVWGLGQERVSLQRKGWERGLVCARFKSGIAPDCSTGTVGQRGGGTAYIPKEEEREREDVSENETSF